jgi:hypothetical protein
MFISKYEREALQEKVENLSLLVAQTSDRAHKSEEKILELSLKLLSIEEVQSQQRSMVAEVVEDFQDIDGLSDEIIAKITTCDSRLESLENYFSSRYRHCDEVDKELKFLSNASRNTVTDILSLDKRFVNFVDSQKDNSTRIKEDIKVLANEQKMKSAKILFVEKSLEVTRAVLFGLKKEVMTNKKDLHNLCKIAVTRDEPVFVFDSGQDLLNKVVKKAKKSYSTKGIKLGPLVKTPEAPWGLKKDGGPRKRPGRPPKITTQS